MPREVPTTIADALLSVMPLINRQGLDNTTVSEIAREARIPRATLYYHFAGRDEILAFLLADVIERVRGAVASSAAASGTGRERLERVIAAQARVVAEDTDAFGVLLANLGRAGPFEAIAQAVDEIVRQPVAAIIRDGIDDGSLRSPDPDLAAVATYALVITMGIWLDAQGTRVTAANLSKRVTELLVHGLTVT